MATLYYSAAHIQVAPDGAVAELSRPAADDSQSALAPSAPEPTPAAGVLRDASSDATQLATQLAEGLAGLLPPPANVVGAALLSILFPSSSIDWAAVFKKFSDIVMDTNTVTTVNTQDGLLNGVLYDLNSYENIKDEQTRKQRVSTLNKYLSNTTAAYRTTLDNKAQWITDMIGYWQKLITDPVPKPQG